MPQLDSTWFASQLFWLVITFAALYLVLSRVILPPLMGVLALRQQTIAGDIDRAQRLKSEAEHARLEYERSLAEARAKAQQLMQDAMEEQKLRSDKASRDMEHLVNEKLLEADLKIHAKKQQLVEALTPTAAELASIIVEKLTSQAPASDRLKHIINDLAKDRD